MKQMLDIEKEEIEYLTKEEYQNIFKKINEEQLKAFASTNPNLKFFKAHFSEDNIKVILASKTGSFNKIFFIFPEGRITFMQKNIPETATIEIFKLFKELQNNI